MGPLGEPVLPEPRHTGAVVILDKSREAAAKEEHDHEHRLGLA
jgi:hypothetical protein